MARILHGTIVTIDQATTASASAGNPLNIPFSMDMIPDFKKFGFLFPALQLDADNLLLPDPATVDALKRLGQTMVDRTPNDEQNSPIPAAYTYLGQFVDHDITFEVVSGDLRRINDADLSPLSLSDIEDKIRNTRSATLDLDSVYGGIAPRDGEKMLVGTNTLLNGTARPRLRPAGKDERNDLPRKVRQIIDAGDSDDVKKLKRSIDREAMIGDPRNDENTIISQLHTAFLRAHNAIVDRGNDFAAARRLLRQHYQWLVLHDLLPRICDRTIVQDVISENKAFTPENAAFFMPLEFTAAAYRFGHSMIRADYDFNVNFNPATLRELFTFTALKGNLGDLDTLPDNWIIEWERFVDGGSLTNLSRRFDTKLVEPLFSLTDVEGNTLPDESRLAVLNLLRGYLLRIPTGQAVAVALNITPLTGTEILAAAASVQQAAVLEDTGLHERTPLWYYILAEAAQDGGAHLGPVGSTLVAEVLVGLVRISEDSILPEGSFSPSLGANAAQFTLNDLLRLGGVLN